MKLDIPGRSAGMGVDRVVTMELCDREVFLWVHEKDQNNGWDIKIELETFLDGLARTWMQRSKLE